MLSWIDVCAGLAAKMLSRGPCVTASVDAVHFLRPCHVRACVRACMRVCVRACVCVARWASVEQRGTAGAAGADCSFCCRGPPRAHAGQGSFIRLPRPPNPLHLPLPPHLPLAPPARPPPV